MADITEDRPMPGSATERYWQLMRERLIKQGYSGETLASRLQAIKDRGTTFRFDKNEILGG